MATPNCFGTAGSFVKEKLGGFCGGAKRRLRAQRS